MEILVLLLVVLLVVCFGRINRLSKELDVMKGWVSGLSKELSALRTEIGGVKTPIASADREVLDTTMEAATETSAPETLEPPTPAMDVMSELVEAEVGRRVPLVRPIPLKTAPSQRTPALASDEDAAAEETVTEEGAPEPEETVEAKTEAPAVQKRTAADLEARIGSTWLMRIGLGVLAIALALFASSVVPDLPPAAKVVLAYAGALAFFGTGKFFETKLEKFARPVMAGGLAFGFFVAFAAYFVAPMRAVSLPVSIAWMVASMILLLVAAERWRSQYTAGLAILLGHISAFVSTGEASTYSLVMIGLLALTAVILLLRHQWVALGMFAVVVSYGSHLLWLLAGNDMVPGDRAFWINLTFLTSYYVVFLIADVIWWRRNHEQPAESMSPTQVISARQLGPTNLVLYVSATAVVFVLSGAGLETVEWFFLTLGAVQGLLAWFYWDVSHRDFVFYPAFGTVLWTLGLFAAFDALALNLILASQALLLLLAAHRTRLWVFHGLAQAVMFVAFIHYLVLPQPATISGALFLGGLGVAAVYLLKAALEEIWYGEGSPEQWFGTHAAERLAEAFAGAFTPLARILAPLHAALGGFVLVREASRYFEPGASLVAFLLGTQLLLLATALVRGRLAWLYALTAIAASVIYFVWLIPGPLATLLLLVGLASSALIVLHFAADRFGDASSGHAGWHAHFIVGFVLIGAFMALAATDVVFPAHLVWLALPILLLVFLGRSGAVGAPVLGEVDGEAERGDRDVGVLTGLLIAGLIVALTAEAVGSVISAPIWVAGWATVILLTAALRKSRHLFIAGYAALVAGYYYFLVVRPEEASRGLSFLFMGFVQPPDLTGQVLSTWWAGLIVTAVPLVLALALDRGIHDRAASGESAAPGSSQLTFITYAAGFLLVAAFAAHQLTAGWALLAAAVLGLGLAWQSERLRTPLSVPAVVAGTVVLHLHFLTRVLADLDGVVPLLPMVLVVAVTFALERVLARSAGEKRDDALVRAGQSALTIVAAVTALNAIYSSTLFGPSWATAGWSILAGAMMAMGFAFKSANHRRVALVVLGVCLLRVFFVDTQGLSDTARTGAFFVLGLSLVGIAWLYTRYSEELKEWL